MSSSAKFAITDLLPLPNSSVKIPRLGFGVYRSPRDTCINSCVTALKAGYRHIDTAQFYANEAEVGEGLRKSGVARSSIFVTTKIMSPKSSLEATYQSALDSVKKIDGENGYVDLFLIHSPSSGSSGRKTLWQALERLHEEGRAKSIGVSNFGRGHIEEMKPYAKVWPPQVNQIELHPWNQQKTIDAYCKEHGIIVEAYCPLVRNRKADDPTLNAIANKYQKTTGQVLIRYALQKDWVPLPKSDTPSRIEANADVFNFDLDAGDMKTLDDLDEGGAGAIVMAVQN
ncbi:putative aldo-keto reductase [Xylona heveae TC161]|uniref:Putative aldo-keto reductase n=1 Tax=Xylona heveae (strain CBS 132557 / TC161) TaxID=1328760 RepID=A0A164ZHJ9_XYLHT|nr:putative aldo-keto reductase [Xylona heveae TC161]KZF19113.1 putative aldo-keto reductase [Xylona heveae TC161]